MAHKVRSSLVRTVSIKYFIDTQNMIEMQILYVEYV